MPIVRRFVLVCDFCDEGLWDNARWTTTKEPARIAVAEGWQTDDTRWFCPYCVQEIKKGKGVSYEVPS